MCILFSLKKVNVQLLVLLLFVSLPPGNSIYLLSDVLFLFCVFLNITYECILYFRNYAKNGISCEIM